MGFFKDFKDDFSQAVNELMPADDNLETSTNEDDVEVNTLEGEVDVETELSKLDGLLEQVTKQEAEKVAAARSAAEMAARNASAPTERAAVPVPASVPEPERNETVSNITKATQEERKMGEISHDTDFQDRRRCNARKRGDAARLLDRPDQSNCIRDLRDC